MLEHGSKEDHNATIDRLVNGTKNKLTEKDLKNLAEPIAYATNEQAERNVATVRCSNDGCENEFEVPVDQVDKEWVCSPCNEAQAKILAKSPQQIAADLRAADRRGRSFFPYRGQTIVTGRNEEGVATEQRFPYHLKPPTDQPKGKKAVRAAKRARAAILKQQEGR